MNEVQEKVNELKVYDYKKGQWIKRKSLKDPTVSSLYDMANEYEEKFKAKHFFIPANIEPEQHPEILDMEKIMLHHLEHYQNDFYLHDLSAHFNKGERGIWLLRNTGTDYIALDQLNEEDMVIYEYYLKANKFYYLVEEGSIKKISKEKATIMVKSILKQVA